MGINSQQAKTRQRFTIAHELCHYVLHPGVPMILDKVLRVNFRDERSGLATDAQEIATKQFAAELLMPAERVTKLVPDRFREPFDQPCYQVWRECSGHGVPIDKSWTPSSVALMDDDRRAGQVSRVSTQRTSSPRSSSAKGSALLPVLSLGKPSPVNSASWPSLADYDTYVVVPLTLVTGAGPRLSI